MLVLLLALQAATASPAPAPERFSILVPVAPQRCPPRKEAQAQGDEVVVCAQDLPDQTVPLPLEYTYPGPRPSNPDLTGTGALAATAPPCAARLEGCRVGFGQPLVEAAVRGLVDLVKDATVKKPDKRGRVPIDIGEPAPAAAPTPAP